MQFKHVTLEFDGAVGILRLDHQEVMNAVSIDMLNLKGHSPLPKRRSMRSTTSGRRCAASC